MCSGHCVRQPPPPSGKTLYIRIKHFFKAATSLALLQPLIIAHELLASTVVNSCTVYMYIMYFSQGYWDIVLKLHWYYVYYAVPCCLYLVLAYMYTYKWLLWMVCTCTHINVYVSNSLYWTEGKLGLCIQICRLWVHWQSPCVVKQTWMIAGLLHMCIHVHVQCTCILVSLARLSHPPLPRGREREREYGQQDYVHIYMYTGWLYC